ncbi:MAG: metalloregulator ArsR/SmtB family transcription factor [Clostridia bacterium]|nr:metalloregulator ArsR/SmtB family transcription factor [Clostridia bacterium]
MSFILPHDHGEKEDVAKIYTELSESSSFLPASELFKIISDSSRLKILWLLFHREECVINISALTEMSSPAVSHHLGILKNAGLIESRRCGKEVYYKAADSETSRHLHKITEEMLEIACPSEKTPYEKTPEEIIEDVHGYLLSHLDKRISIDSLSRIFLINKTTLKEAFKRVYGTSLASHINVHRMEKAASMLDVSDKSISEISRSVGFASQSRFSEAFRKHFGVSPKDYRKNH